MSIDPPVSKCHFISMDLPWMTAPVQGMGHHPFGTYQGYPFRVRKSYGTGAEAHAVDAEIGDFNFRESLVMAELERSFGRNVRVRELKSIICAVRLWLRHRGGIELPKPSRNTMRSFPLMVKYLETHYSAAAPVLHMLTLCDESKNPLYPSPGSE
jgi:hypothetical protein